MDNIAKQFQVKPTLNPDFWDEDQNLDPEVRTHLLRIGSEFVKKVNLHPRLIKDVILTGSSANFNWSSASDVDLHLIVDYSTLPNAEDFESLFDDEKKLWNLEHSDITIHGFPVEIYLQIYGQPLYASGVFSLLKNKWLKEPTKEKIVIDNDALKKKTKMLKQRIDDVLENPTTEKIDALRDKLHDIRTAGLENGGEFSIENLAYKLLRRDGYLDKLIDIQQQTFDEELSL
jgi:predicted DNA-binding antitoxin AbrB/MazE fold protein